jgi:hypothetical protein
VCGQNDDPSKYAFPALIVKATFVKKLQAINGLGFSGGKGL